MLQEIQSDEYFKKDQRLFSFCENVLYVCNSAAGARARVVTHRILDAALLHAPLFVPLSSSYDKHFYTLDV